MLLNDEAGGHLVAVAARDGAYVVVGEPTLARWSSSSHQTPSTASSPIFPSARFDYWVASGFLAQAAPALAPTVST